MNASVLTAHVVFDRSGMTPEISRGIIEKHMNGELSPAALGLLSVLHASLHSDIICPFRIVVEDLIELVQHDLCAYSVEPGDRSKLCIVLHQISRSRRTSFSKREVLRHMLGVGWKTADEILNGDRTMTDSQKDQLRKYNEDAGLEYQIDVPERS